MLGGILYYWISVHQALSWLLAVLHKAEGLDVSMHNSNYEQNILVSMQSAIPTIIYFNGV